MTAPAMGQASVEFVVVLGVYVHVLGGLSAFASLVAWLSVIVTVPAAAAAAAVVVVGQDLWTVEKPRAR